MSVSEGRLGVGNQVSSLRPSTPGYALVKRRGLALRLEAELFAQHPAASLILGDSRAALPVQGQQFHRLAMGLFPPRLHLQLAINVLQGLPVFGSALMVRNQALEHLHRLSA